MASPLDVLKTVFDAPREFGGLVYIPEGQRSPTTVSHENVHAGLSRLARFAGPLGVSLTGARIAAGLLPDEFNPEEELAYRLESPPDPYALKLRRASRRSVTNPALRLLSGLYGDKP